MADLTIITAKDVQAAGYCLAGSKKWFEAHHVDFRDFIRNGIPTDRLPKGDAMVEHVLKVKAKNG